MESFSLPYICRATQTQQVNVSIVIKASKEQGLARITRLQKNRKVKWPINQATTY